MLKILCLFSLLSPLLHAAPAAFTINQILSAPFASAPLASPTGAKVAWLENEQGKRNIFVASSPSWKAQKITSFSKDDGQEIADLSWSHDGSYLVFARGGDFENGGDNPNPALSTSTPEQEIWYAAADGSILKKLTTGNSPAVSPAGGLIAFLRAGQIFTMLPTGSPSGEEIKKAKPPNCIGRTMAKLSPSSPAAAVTASSPSTRSPLNRSAISIRAPISTSNPSGLPTILISLTCAFRPPRRTSVPLPNAPANLGRSASLMPPPASVIPSSAPPPAMAASFIPSPPPSKFSGPPTAT